MVTMLIRTIKLVVFIFILSFISCQDSSDKEFEGIEVESTQLLLEQDSDGNIKIQDCEDLMNLSKEEDLSGSYVLTEDINCEDTNLVPIGTEDNPFSGIFSGQNSKQGTSNFEISNLEIEQDSSDDLGLFGVVEGAIIKHLTLRDITIIWKEMIMNFSVGTNPYSIKYLLLEH